MIRTIIGMRGTGKTTLAKRFLKYRSLPVIVVDPLSQFDGKRFFSAKELLDHITTRGLTISKPLIATIYEPVDFAIICKMAILHKNIMLVVDEVDLFDSPISQDPSFKKIVHLGRHYNIDLVTTSRRPANISRDLTSQTGKFFVFKVTEKRDLDYFSYLNSDLPDKIKELKNYYHIEYDHISIKTLSPL